MLYREIFKVLASYLYIFALLLLIPLLVSFYDDATWAFVNTFLVTLGVASLFYLWGRKGGGKLYRREGLTLVVALWFLAPLLGGLPFLFQGVLSHPLHAYFESVSGFTTTGATILEAKRYDPATGKEIPIEKIFEGIEPVRYRYYGTIAPLRDEAGAIIREGIEAVPRSLLFWRSFSQWIGGIGITILFVSILPALGAGGRFLVQSETTGPIKESLTPRIKETAARVWKIYVGLSLLEVMALLFLTPVSIFEAITLTFSTISTGGFSLKNGNIQAYNSPVLEWVLIVFMICGSINFTLYHFWLKGRFNRFKDPELILFGAILAIFSLFAGLMLLGDVFQGWEAFRIGAFQTISAITSTGFVAANYDIWPYEVQVLLLIGMFIGGMSGSTAGGIKVLRHLLLLKISANKIETLFRPETIRSVQVGGREIDQGMAVNVLCFFFLFIALSALATFFYAIDGIDPETSLGLVSCMINNSGMAFREAGPESSCAFLSDQSLLLSIFWMILGRLELFAILVLFIPAFWKQEI